MKNKNNNNDSDSNDNNNDSDNNDMTTTMAVTTKMTINNDNMPFMWSHCSLAALGLQGPGITRTWTPVGKQLQCAQGAKAHNYLMKKQTNS